MLVPIHINRTNNTDAIHRHHAMPSVHPDRQAAARAARLSFLLDKSTIYAKIIGDRMERQQIEKRKAEQRAAVRKEKKEKKGEVVGGREGMRKKDRVGGEKVEEEKAAEKTGTTGKRRRRGETTNKQKSKVKDEGVDVSRSTQLVPLDG